MHPLKPFNCLRLVLSFSLVMSIHSILLWNNKCNNNNAEITPFIPVLAGWNLHMSQTLSHQRRDSWPINCTPKDAHASGFFSILPALHTQDTFMLILNFEVGHFACHLLLSVFLLVLLWKEFNPHSFLVTFHFSFMCLTTCFSFSWVRLLDSCKRRLFCPHIQHATHCLFERQTLDGSSEVAVCKFCLSISLHYLKPFNCENKSHMYNYLTVCKKKWLMLNYLHWMAMLETIELCANK